MRALGLGAPQVIGGDLDLTERVLLDADLIMVAIAGWHVAPHGLEAPQSPFVTRGSAPPARHVRARPSRGVASMLAGRHLLVEIEIDGRGTGNQSSPAIEGEIFDRPLDEHGETTEESSGRNGHVGSVTRQVGNSRLRDLRTHR